MNYSNHWHQQVENNLENSKGSTSVVQLRYYGELSIWRKSDTEINVLLYKYSSKNKKQNNIWFLDFQYSFNKHVLFS